MATQEIWAKRFGTVALVNALIAIVWIVFPIFVDTRISRTVAGGSVGTWGYLGFVLFITIGFTGFAGFSFLYHIMPRQAPGSPLPWLHLALMEIGTLGATALLGVAGYIGGATILEETARGTAAREIPRLVHSKVGFVVEPIPLVAIFAGLAGLGVLVGVISMFVAFKKGTE